MFECDPEEIDFRIFDGTRWKVCDPVLYRTHDGKLIAVPADTETDLASIPGLARVFFPVNDKHRLAAVVHDYLYLTQKIEGQWIDQERADRVFYDAMIDLGVSGFQSRVMWVGVKVGGSQYFNPRGRNIGNPLVPELKKKRGSRRPV